MIVVYVSYIYVPRDTGFILNADVVTSITKTKKIAIVPYIG